MRLDVTGKRPDAAVRRCAWLMVLVAAGLLLWQPAAEAVDLGGFANLFYGSTKTDEDGEVTKTRTFSQNYYLRLNHEINPMLTYQLFIRTFLSNQRTVDADGDESNQYNRSFEPTFDLTLRNPLWNASVGYRRNEAWTTANLKDDGRITTDYYYARLNLTPRDFPLFSFQADRLKKYDYLSPSAVDNSRTTYSANSYFNTTYKDVIFDYTANYIHAEEKNPVSITSRTTTDDFSGSYNIGYRKGFWNNRLSVFASYKGQYVQNRTERFSEGSGVAVVPRFRLDGLYGQDAVAPFDISIGFLPSNPALIDANTTVPTAIDLAAAVPPYHNIGVAVSAGSTVDRIYLYVNRNVLTETTLASAANWQAHVSNNNFPGMSNALWTQISVASVSVAAFDIPNGIYRYEIVFASPQNAQFYKVINLQASSLGGNVFVTEIEALGTDVVNRGTSFSSTTTFTQGVNANAIWKLLPKVTFTAGFFINRSDLNPDSVFTSAGGVFSNILTKKITGDADQVNVTRSYTAGVTWLTHRLLTTNARVTRNEAFDNRDLNDFASNIYALSFSSAPLPTLDANLSLTHTDSFLFGAKNFSNDTAILTVGTRLYDGINMVTDFGYLKSRSYGTDTESTTTYVAGNLSATLTPRLSGSLLYTLNWVSADSGKSDTQDATLLLTYRPGRFINLTGNLRVTNNNGDLTLVQGFLVDWLPIPTVRLNLSYQYSWQEPRPDITETISSYVLWKITKFAEAQLTYAYTREEKEKKRKSYSLTANLNCRFW